MFLGYYKYILKEILHNICFNFILRYKGNIIGKNCNISKEVIINGKIKIKDNVIIGKNVILNNNVRIGSNTYLENIEVGENSFIESGVKITGNGNGKIRLGKESYIGINNVLDFSDNIIIGDYVHIAGPSTCLWTHTSAPMCIKSIPLDNENKIIRPIAPIIIENNVYIGPNCTIYPGVTIGHHSIIAPNSAVTRNVEPYTMVGGVPAKFIKNLNDELKT